MNKKLLFSFALLFMSFYPALSFAQKRTRAVITPDQFKHYNMYNLEGAGRRVFNAIMRGKIAAYKDAELKGKWEPKELNKALTEKITIQVSIEPMDNSIYNDSVVYALPDSNMYFRFKAFGPDKNPVIGFDDKWFTDPFKAKYYVSLNDMKTVLNGEQRLLVAYFIGVRDKYNSLLDSNALLAISNDWFSRLAYPLYESAVAGKVQCYKSDSMMKPYKLEDAKEVGNYEVEVMEIDTMTGDQIGTRKVKSIFSAGDITGISYIDVCTQKKQATTFTTIALSPCFTQYISYSFALPPRDMFYLHYGQAIKLYSSTDYIAYLNGLIHYNRMRMLDKTSAWDSYDGR